MKRKLLEHILSIIFVSVLLIAAIFVIRKEEQQKQTERTEQLQPFLEQDFIDLSDPFNKALLKETLSIYSGMSPAGIDSLIGRLESYYTESLLSGGEIGKEELDINSFLSILRMYLKFIFAYVITILFTYYAVQTLATVRFLRYKQDRESYLAEMVQMVKHIEKKKPWNYYAEKAGKVLLLFFKATLKGMLSLMLFAPAYVIAYSFRTRFDTDSMFFLILLGVISNGLLIPYAQKFFTYLVGESRKGYVETALVKNLDHSYRLNKPGGIPYGKLFSLHKTFPGHVFDHIFSNARYQYLGTIKEQASFLITGLIIIEMALNIQGHLCYELLQNILYRNYELVILILLGIFYLVKATEIVVDWVVHHNNLKYENRK
jgi:hypothetical protein